MKKVCCVFILMLCSQQAVFAQTTLSQQLQAYVGQPAAQIMNHLNIETNDYHSVKTQSNQNSIQYQLTKNQSIALSQANISTLMQTDYLPLLSFAHNGIQQSNSCSVTFALHNNIVSSVQYQGDGC